MTRLRWPSCFVVALSTETRPAFLEWLEPWFAAYALVGLLVNGIVPVLIPLTARSHGPLVVGLVVASFFAGQLTAPVIGSLADRRGCQRAVFLASYPVMGIAAVVFGVTHGPVFWVPAALVAGAAAGAAQTLGSVFIVEGHPESEWDIRIGWFRLTFGLGQVAGLVIGAVFAMGDVHVGWMVAGGAICSGIFLVRLGLPRLHRVKEPTSNKRSRRSALRRELKGKFGRFLATWLLAMIAVQTILNVLPLIMHDAFGVDASRAATVYLGGSLAGALLYPVCGALLVRLPLA